MSAVDAAVANCHVTPCGTLVGTATKFPMVALPGCADVPVNPIRQSAAHVAVLVHVGSSDAMVGRRCGCSGAWGSADDLAWMVILIGVFWAFAGLWWR